MSYPYTQADVNAIADYLCGTCSVTLEMAVADHFAEDEAAQLIDDVAFCQKIDQLVLQCAECGWFEASEDTVVREGEVICVDCTD